MRILFANNQQAALNAPVAAWDNTIVLTPGFGANFPQPLDGEYFVVTLCDVKTGLIYEIVHVTHMNGDIATVDRAQEGTEALAWNVGDIFSNYATAGQFANFVQADCLYFGSYSTTFASAGPPPFNPVLAVDPTTPGTWELIGPTGMYSTTYSTGVPGTVTWYYVKRQILT